MTTEKDIDLQINNEVAKHNDSIYDGNVPEELIEMFKRALRCMPPASHRYDMIRMKSLIQKRPNEVTVEEIGWMINLIYAVSFKEFDMSVEDGIDMIIRLNVIHMEYNKSTAAFERKIIAKKQKLMEISGLSGNTHRLTPR